jgi:hypothetical protein
LQDEASDLSPEEQQRSVLALRDHSHSLYQDCREAGRVGDLPRTFRLALHHQARLLYGPRAGVPSTIAAAWGEGAEEESEGAEQGPGDGTGVAPMSDGEGDGAECRGGLASPEQHMAQRGRTEQRSASRERSHSYPGQPPLRSSSRVPSAPGAWWKAPAPAPTPTTTPRQAASARTGKAGAGGGCRRQ